ncbi:MAG: polysaccharide biosynthesis protein, partial [Planctomycetota bacterium]
MSLSGPDITQAEIDAVVDVLRTPQLSLGPRLPEFETAFCSRLGVRHAIATNSGTSAMHLVWRAMGIGEGDEVITTPFSFIASSNSILFEQARPVFVDIDPQ